MSSSGRGGRKYGQNETSLDVLKDIVAERLSRDDFAAEADEIPCKVLKVFTPPRNSKLKSWIDFHLPYRGKPPQVVAFYGRIHQEGRMHIHSLMPDPSNYTDKALEALQKSGASYATSKESLRERRERMIELYPIFVAVVSLETPVPKVGDIVTVRFPVKYSIAGGERVGFYVKKSVDKAAPNVDLDVSEGGGAKPFTPEARKARPAPPNPSPPANIPTNILMVGDEMFSSSPTKSVRTSFAKKIQAYIRSFYKLMVKHAAPNGMSDAQAKKIAKYFSISNPDIVKAASKKFFAVKAEVEMIAMETTVFTAGKDTYETDPTEGMTDEEIDEFYAQKDLHDLAMKQKRERLFNPKFHMRAWAYTDISFFSKDGENIHSGKEGSPQIVLTAQETKDLKNKHGKKWKKNIPTRPTAFGVIKNDVGTFSKLPTHQQPDFFIIAGPVGHSAVPGWNAPLAGTTKYDWIWDAGIGKAGAKKKINYNVMMEYCRIIAEEEKDAFVKYKKEHYAQLIDLMFKFKNMQGGIIIGPPVIYQKGKEAATKTQMVEKHLQILEWNKASVFDPPLYTWAIRPQKSLPKKERYTLAFAPIHDPNYWYRQRLSEAMAQAAKDAGKDKVWTILPYKGLDFTRDGSAPIALRKQKFKSLWYTDSGRRKYAGVVLEAICHHIAQKPASSMPKGRPGWEEGRFTGSENFAKLERDMRLVALLRKRMVELREYYGEDSTQMIRNIKKEISDLIAGYAKGVVGGAHKMKADLGLDHGESHSKYVEIK